MLILKTYKRNKKFSITNRFDQIILEMFLSKNKNILQQCFINEIIIRKYCTLKFPYYFNILQLQNFTKYKFCIRNLHNTVSLSYIVSFMDLYAFVHKLLIYRTGLIYRNPYVAYTGWKEYKHFFFNGCSYNYKTGYS